MIIISACLLDLPTRYNLEKKGYPDLIELLKRGIAIPVCPEQLGGLPTPRSEATIHWGDGADVIRGDSKIVDSEGKDLTENFTRGAYAVLTVAKLVRAEEAILKEGSPSCGVRYTNRCFKRIEGMGVLSYLLNSNGIKLRGVE